MIRYTLPIAYALFLWWFSTGAIFYLDTRPARTFRWSMAGATVLLGAALVAIAGSGGDTSVASAYLAFTGGLIAWGWLEIGYYLGFMVGPRRLASAETTRGWRLFGEAIATTLYHELAALALMAVIGAMTWNMPNTTGFWTFVTLWLMQVSAKLNVFLGVPNLAESVLPAHLAFLGRFMRRRPMNAWFPVSLTVSVVATTLLATQALSSDATAGQAVGLMLLTTLMGLAVFEHWCLVVPVPVEALWRWATQGGGGDARGTLAGPARDPSPDSADLRPARALPTPPSLNPPLPERSPA